MGVGEVIMCLIHADQFCRLHTTYKGIETSICSIVMMSTYSKQMSSHTYKNDIEGPVLLHTRCKRIHCKRPILCNLDWVPILLKDLDSQLLVHLIVLGEKDVEYHVVCCHPGTDRLQGRDECWSEVLHPHQCSHLWAYAVVQTPFHYNIVSTDEQSVSQPPLNGYHDVRFKWGRF